MVRRGFASAASSAAPMWACGCCRRAAGAAPRASGQRILFVAQVAHRDEVETAPGLVAAHQAYDADCTITCAFVRSAALGDAGLRPAEPPRMAGTLERMLRCLIRFDVGQMVGNAVGTRTEGRCECAARKPAMESAGGGHARRSTPAPARPARCSRTSTCAIADKKALPARRGVPVTVVGCCKRRRDDDHARLAHGADLGTTGRRHVEARGLAGVALAAALRDDRRRTMSAAGRRPERRTVALPQRGWHQPDAWELAHLAWFAEFWILRGPHRAGDDGLVHAAVPPRIAGPDAHFDSARLAHARALATPLPSRRQLSEAWLRSCERLHALPPGDGDAALYFHRLALFHEDMHGGSLHVASRASLGLPAPAGCAALPRHSGARRAVGAGRTRSHRLWPAGRRGFAFDNELPGCCVELQRASRSTPGR